MATRNRTRSTGASKTPLKSPSNALVNALNNISISTPQPQKKHSNHKHSASAHDITNPFIAERPKSRPVTPVKRASAGIPVSESLKSQASGGVIRKGGVESRLDVVTRDYAPPQAKPEIKRSRSTPAVRDRFIPAREESDVAATLEQMHLNPKSASPGHTARLAQATGVPINRRILGYHEPPPAASSDHTLAQQREIARPLYTRPGALPSSNGAYKDRASPAARKIATAAERVLDAPGMVDDYYLNLISWSCLNFVAVALGEATYVWNAESGEVRQVGEAPAGSYVSGVDWSNDGMFLGVGLGNGDVELWDAQKNVKLRTMAGHQGQVAVLTWHGHILSSGCGDGSIWHHDVRAPRHKVMELLGHSGEVCGLKWREDGELIASGGNDNVVNIWDGRMGEDVLDGGTAGTAGRGNAKWTKRNHTAAVKAIAWCPWQPSLLASGGGTNDATINIWNSTTGARLHTVSTPSQVTSIIWSPHRKEFCSTHGYPTNSLMLHAYPSMDRVIEIRDAHECRLLWSALGPLGDVVCTGAGDENLKFWRLWEAPKKVKGKGKESGVEAGTKLTTRGGILSLR